jgi:hypothetical protein
MFAVEKFGAKDFCPKQGSEIFRPTFFAPHFSTEAFTAPQRDARL